MTEIVNDRVVAGGGAESSDTESTHVGAVAADASAIDGVLEDELVEDVSIDGMCGVY